METNTLMALNNHLFAQMERLGEEDLSDDELKKEVGRSKAMCDVSSKIIDNAKLALEAEQLKVEYASKTVNIPKMIESGD